MRISLSALIPALILVLGLGAVGAGAAVVSWRVLAWLAGIIGVIRPVPVPELEDMLHRR